MSDGRRYFSGWRMPGLSLKGGAIEGAPTFTAEGRGPGLQGGVRNGEADGVAFIPSILLQPAVASWMAAAQFQETSYAASFCGSAVCGPAVSTAWR